MMHLRATSLHLLDSAGGCTSPQNSGGSSFPFTDSMSRRVR
jgi:hypothetical protein